MGYMKLGEERWAFNALQTKWTEPGVGGARWPAHTMTPHVAASN